MGTGIEWCDATANLIVGCSRVSEGCRRFYAEQAAAMVVRTTRGAAPCAQVVRTAGGEPRWNGDVACNTDQRWYSLRALPRRDPPLRVFINSMGDLFHERAVATGLTAAAFGEIRIARHLTCRRCWTGGCTRSTRGERRATLAPQRPGRRPRPPRPHSRVMHARRLRTVRRREAEGDHRLRPPAAPLRQPPSRSP